MKKLSNTEAELKKHVAYKKKNVFETKDIEPNLRGLESFDIRICLLFDWYCQSFVCRRETGHGLCF